MPGGNYSMSINYGTLIPILAAVFFSGLGAVLIVLSMQRKRKEDVTKNWQPTPGTILSSEVVEHTAMDSSQNGGTSFTPMVRYQYSCMGTAFTGFRVTFNSVDYSREKAQQLVSRFSAGNSVTVYYDPLHPDEAVLEKNARSSNLLFTAGLILCAAGLSACLIALLVFWIGKAAW